MTIMNTTFHRELHLPVSAEDGFTWHERRGALERLIPPWENVAILSRGDGVRDGSTVKLVQRIGPFRAEWIAKHHGYEPGRAFRDSQLSGPFTRWEHLHEFRPNGDGNGVLVDHIDYQPPGGVLGRWLTTKFIKRKVATMFTYRHRTTRDDLAAHSKYQEVGNMHVAVTGASGMVGSTLVPLLTTGDHRVTRMVRRESGEGELTWDPQGDFDATPLEGVDAVVHLAGKNIAAARWSPKVKAEILDSRVTGTRTLCEALANLERPPKVFVCASATGFYGDRDDEVLTEASPAGSGFLADVVEQWEAATQPARDAGIRVVQLRFGMILGPRDGALAKMLLPFKLGAGGRVGSGQQYWGWISIDDAAGAIHHALMTESLAGPVNVVAPQQVTNLEFTKTLGRVLNRPTILPLPKFGARLALGEMADALLLASTRVEPRELERSGYAFRQPTLEMALRHLLGKTAQE